MSKTFRILYIVNLLIIVGGLLTPIFKMLTDVSSAHELLLGYYAVVTVLSVTFCISFFGLNLYGALKYRLHRTRYYIIAIFLCVWIIWGACQIAYGYAHGVAL
jgi:hypothetical protein